MKYILEIIDAENKLLEKFISNQYMHHYSFNVNLRIWAAENNININCFYTSQNVFFENNKITKIDINKFYCRDLSSVKIVYLEFDTEEDRNLFKLTWG